MHFKWITCVAILYFSGFLAGNNLFASPIPVISATKTTNGVTLTMQPGVMRLQVCGDRTIHVTYSPMSTPPDGSKSFAVLKQPAPGAFQVKEEMESITLQTDHMQVMVNKKTGALAFADHNSKTFLEEEPGGGKTLTPSTVVGVSTNTVDQIFVRDPTEGLYGLGQHPDPGTMNYAGTTVHLQQKNMDVAVPVLVSSRGYGVFWNNPAVTDVKFSPLDSNATVEWSSEFGSAIDYYVFYGTSIDQVISGYRDLTGAAPLFGRWAYGFWQCKEHYATQQELLDVATHYRKMQVPIDNIIQDWFYWDPHPWGSHQFDENRYPDPASLMKDLHAENIHAIISVWAKFEAGSVNADEMSKNGDLYTTTFPENNRATTFYDPFKPQARQLYWQQMSKELFSKGFDGWWLDASEPELSTNYGEFRNYTTAAGPGAEVNNAYPLMHTTSVYEGQRAENSDKRVFILTRSAYAGQQRNAAVTWSGDIRGTWDVFKKQVPDGINFSLSGIPYWNTDTGGFFGGDPQDPAYAELFTRWFQFSAFCPMFRVHGTNAPKEMWRFDDATQKILIQYDKLRYHLMPYIYSVAWSVTHENSTMMRGLVMDFRDDAKVYGLPDQYMFGPALMVNPVTRSYVPDSSPIPSSQLSDKSGGAGALTGTYFQGINFDQQKLERRDAAINFNWDQDAPDPGMQRELFSIRWEGSVLTKAAGNYVFTLSADDGMRLWVNGQMIVDDWHSRPLETRTGRIHLPAATKVPIKIEYYQDQDKASINLGWVTPDVIDALASRSVYLPAQTSWYDFWTGQQLPGGQTIDAASPIETMPLYVRAGSIIPYGPEVQSAMENEDPIELRVYPGADGNFTFYEDENDSYNYEKGAYATIPISWNEKNQTLTIGKRSGTFSGMLEHRTFRIVWVSPQHGSGIDSTTTADATVQYVGDLVRVARTAK